MIVKDFISSNIRALSLTDTVDQAKELMRHLHVTDLPLVEKEWVVGQIFEESLIDQNPDTKIEKLYFDAIQPFAASDHLFSTSARLEHHHAECIPVVDAENKYIGCVLIQDLLLGIQKFMNFTENGAILVLKLPSLAYSMAEVARLVEENKALILGSSVSKSIENEHLLTIKLNTQIIGPIVATFERFSYEVAEAFNFEPFDTQEKLRYDNLMKYLSI